MHLVHIVTCRRRPSFMMVVFCRLGLKVRRVACIDLGTLRPNPVILLQVTHLAMNFIFLAQYCTTLNRQVRQAAAL